MLSCCTDAPGLLCSIWMTFSLYPHATQQVGNHDMHCSTVFLHWATCSRNDIPLQESARSAELSCAQTSTLIPGQRIVLHLAVQILHDGQCLPPC